ncbi:MAG: asparagine synthase (glutamine-hydrolyzing) [Chloroflexota bacterium]
MCGICGELELIPATGTSDSTFNHLTNMMTRRGPDSSGKWLSFAGGNRMCRLGFRRLAILDLTSSANQPMVAADGRFGLVYNGELYNYRELRLELEQKGFLFQTTGDTEVVLFSLIHWGREALNRFNGMFVLGFFDQENHSLLLARDHAGIKPLYYLLTGQGLFFASQYDQILAHPWRAGLPVSQEGIGLYLRLGYIPAPYAILEKTHMLEPGTWLHISGEGLVSRGEYYRFPVYSRPDLFGDEAIEAIDSAITGAVKRQMVSDVPIGAFLSGGVDSPLVTAKMQANSGREIRAYTIGNEGSLLDESFDASSYAREIGVDHVLEHFTPDKALACLDDVVLACSEPFADSSIFPTLMISGLAHRDTKVILSGDGGDELFWGYAERFGSILRRATEFRASNFRRSMHWRLRRAVNDGVTYGYLRWPTIGSWQREKHSLIKQETLANIFETQILWPANLNLYHFDGWEEDRTAQWLRWNEFVGHLGKILLKVDRGGMYHSLEVRVPLLDREVIDVATRIDWRQCLDLQTGIGKLPLRQALSRHVSSQTRSKRGFQIPLSDWFRGPFRDLFVERVLNRQDLLGMRLNKSELARVFSLHLNGKSDFSGSLWTLLSFAMWSDHYLTSGGLRPESYSEQILLKTVGN